MSRTAASASTFARGAVPLRTGAVAAAGAAARDAGAVPPLAAEELTVRYGRRTAVDSVSLTLPEGAVYALLGRNGAGKS
ncbi:MAG: hypothetical protein JOZ15_10060, partial [Acidobacteria bacterium]|nr:hypothetical protein [Acidobacteriota bacterium]